MKLDLLPGTFVRRYKRFFADVLLDDGREVVAHCPNTGSMKTLLEEGAPAFVTPNDDPKRKLRFTLTLLGLKRRKLAMVDTSLPNALVADAIAAGDVPELDGYAGLRREVKYGTRNSRIDIVLDPAEGDGRSPCWIEVKNCTMASSVAEGRCDFPDAVTQRGLKHLEEMSDLAREGARVVQFFLVSRSDCTSCGVASEIDPAYHTALLAAQEAGVEILAYRLGITRRKLALSERCPFIA